MALITTGDGVLRNIPHGELKKIVVTYLHHLSRKLDDIMNFIHQLPVKCGLWNPMTTFPARQ